MRLLRSNLIRCIITWILVALYSVLNTRLPVNYMIDIQMNTTTLMNFLFNWMLATYALYIALNIVMSLWNKFCDWQQERAYNAHYQAQFLREDEYKLNAPYHIMDSIGYYKGIQGTAFTFLDIRDGSKITSNGVRDWRLATPVQIARYKCGSGIEFSMGSRT